MGLSANERAPAEFDVSAFVEIAQDPARYKQILTELAELKACHAALDRRTQELDDRERVVEAREAEAGRVKAHYEARAAKLTVALVMSQ